MYSFIFPIEKPLYEPEFFLLGLDYIGKIKPSDYSDDIELILENA